MNGDARLEAACTEADIRRLMWEAATCGHQRWVRYCELALAGDAIARGSCAELLRVAAELPDVAPAPAPQVSAVTAPVVSVVTAVPAPKGPGVAAIRAPPAVAAKKQGSLF